MNREQIAKEYIDKKIKERNEIVFLNKKIKFLLKLTIAMYIFGYYWINKIVPLVKNNNLISEIMICFCLLLYIGHLTTKAHYGEI